MSRHTVVNLAQAAREDAAVQSVDTENVSASGVENFGDTYAQQIEDFLSESDSSFTDTTDSGVDGFDSGFDNTATSFPEPVQTSQEPIQSAYTPPPANPFQTQFTGVSGSLSQEDEALSTLQYMVNNSAGSLQSIIGSISKWQTEVDGYQKAVRKLQAQLQSATSKSKLTEYTTAITQCDINYKSCLMSANWLSEQRKIVDKVPELVETVKSNLAHYQETGKADIANQLLNTRYPPAPSTNLGALGLYSYLCMEHSKLVQDWRNYETAVNFCKSLVGVAQQQVQYSEEVRQPISAQAQANANTAFNHYGTGSSRGMFVGLEELNKILYSAIEDYTGNNLGCIKSFGITDDGDIIINGKSFVIGNYMQLSEGDAAKLPDIYRSQLENGKWGCVMDFGKLHRFTNLQVLDISRAPVRKMDIVVELGIDKGKWTQLFKRKSKFPNLMEIRLPSPEGIITRNAGVAQTFKSNAEYERFSNEYYAENSMASAPVNRSQAINEHNAVALQSMGSGLIETFKNKLWSKPIPRLLTKTLGYGAGIPLYWGLMTALGPFAMVMGALGIGAMAHYEYKNFKDKGSI